MLLQVVERIDVLPVVHQSKDRLTNMHTAAAAVAVC
jgi:hypothetical protein